MVSRLQPVEIALVGPQNLAAGLENAAVEGGLSLSVTTVMSAVAADELDEPDCVVVDQRAIDSVGKTLDTLTDVRPELPVVLFVTDSYESTVETALRQGADDYLPRSVYKSHPSLAGCRIASIANVGKVSLESDNGTGREHAPHGTNDPALARTTQQFRLITENVDEIIYVTNEDFSEVEYVNPAYEDIWGRPVEEVYENARAFIDGIDERDRESFLNDFESMLGEIERGEADDSYEFEFRVRKPDGTVRWVLATGYPVATETGADRFVGIVEDVTERRELQRTYRELFESVSDGLVVHQPGTGEITDVNQRFCEMNGYSREQLVGETVGLITADEDRYSYERARQMIRRAREEGPQLFEWRNQHKNGDTYPVEVHLTCAKLGGEERVLASVRDISERKEAQERLRENERTYRELFNKVSAAITIHDPDTKAMVRVNDTMCELLGYDRETILDLDIDGVSITDEGYTGDRGAEIIDRIMATGEREEYEWVIEDAGGDRHVMLVTGTPATISGEKRLLATSYEITGRKRRERTVQNLQGAIDRMQDADDAAAIYDIVVETARDVLDLPMTACWRYEAGERQLTFVAGTEPVEEMVEGPVSFTPADYEYDVFTNDEAVTYDPSQYHDHNPLDRSILVPIGDSGLFAAGEVGRTEYESYLVDAAGALAGHAATALDRVERERQLRESEHRLQAIIDRIDETIFLAPVTELDEAQPAPDFVSSGYEDIWGQPLDGLHDTYEEGFFGTLHPDDYEGYRAFIDRIIDEVTDGNPAQRYTREYRIERPDGEVRWVHSDFYPTTWNDSIPRIVIVSRDVTDRKRRERTLESFHDATAELTTADTVADAGRLAVEAAADVFDIPATAVYNYDETTALLEPTATGPELPNPDTLAPLSADDTDVWESFVSETMDRVETDDASQLAVGPGDEALLFPLGGNGVLIVWTTGETFDTEAASILAATLEAALNRLRGEQRLESRRAELQAQTERARRLEAITELTQRIEAAITTQSSRQGVQTAVCEELTDVDLFDAAWIAAAEVGTEQLTPRAIAGLDRDRVGETLKNSDTTRADPHPTRKAWQSGEPHVVNELVGSGRRSDWRHHLLREGVGSVCAVPVAYSGVTYGVLTVVADEPNTFDDREVDVLSQLGTSVGYAITAMERQRALESDETLELEFHGTGMELPFARLARATSCRVCHERTMRRQDGSVSVYYSLIGEIPARLSEHVSDTLSGDVTVVSRQDGEAVVARHGSSWFGSVVSEYGGILRRGRASDSGVTLIIELPKEADTRTIVERLQTEFPALELTAQRQHHEGESTVGELQTRLEQRLSDRQYEALKTAYEMGYFDWPRESSGEAVADTLGITQPTINKHIRLGEGKVFDVLFGSTN